MVASVSLCFGLFVAVAASPQQKLEDRVRASIANGWIREISVPYGRYASRKNLRDQRPVPGIRGSNKKQPGVTNSRPAPVNDMFVGATRPAARNWTMRCFSPRRS